MHNEVVCPLQALEVIAMKSSLRVVVLMLFIALAGSAWAHGGGQRGWHGPRHGGHVYYSNGWNSPWVGPVLGAAIVGTAIYASSTPSYAVVQPPVVTVAPPAPPAPRVAYFCGTSQQYYPTVPTCNVPWQLVSY